MGCQSEASEEPKYILPDEEAAVSVDAAAIADSFAQEIVVATYGVLVDRTLLLEASVEDLQDDLDAASLESARSAWLSARQPWEVSTAFMFGPIHSLGLDVSLDTWPIDTVSLELVLGEEEAMDQAGVARLDNTLQGLHTAEFLIFGPDGDKEVEDLTDQELAYLQAVAAQVTDESQQLHDAWTDGTDEAPAYAGHFSGETTGVYSTPISALYEVGRGMSAGLEEISEARLEALLEAQEPSAVESHFSGAMRQDLVDTLKGVRAVYLGENHLTQSGQSGLSQLIAADDPDLDAQIKAELGAALESIQALPPRLGTRSLTDAQRTEVEAAQEVLRSVRTTVDETLLSAIGG